MCTFTCLIGQHGELPDDAALLCAEILTRFNCFAELFYLFFFFFLADPSVKQWSHWNERGLLLLLWMQPYWAFRLKTARSCTVYRQILVRQWKSTQEYQIPQHCMVILITVRMDESLESFVITWWTSWTTWLPGCTYATVEGCQGDSYFIQDHNNSKVIVKWLWCPKFPTRNVCLWAFDGPTH